MHSCIVLTERDTWSDCIVVVLPVTGSCYACRAKTKAQAQSVSNAAMGLQSGQYADLHSSKPGSGVRAMPKCPSSPGHNADARQEALHDGNSDPCTGQDKQNEGSSCAQMVLESQGLCQTVGGELGLNQHQSPIGQKRQNGKNDSQNCLQTPARSDPKVSKRQRAESGAQLMPENDEPNHDVMLRGKRARS